MMPKPTPTKRYGVNYAINTETFVGPTTTVFHKGFVRGVKIDISH